MVTREHLVVTGAGHVVVSREHLQREEERLRVPRGVVHPACTREADGAVHGATAQPAQVEACNRVQEAANRCNCRLQPLRSCTAGCRVDQLIPVLLSISLWVMCVLHIPQLTPKRITSGQRYSEGTLGAH